MNYYEQVEEVVVNSGLWNATPKHRFVLSPSVYQLDLEQLTQLQQLGIALFECLSGVGRIAASAANPELTRNTTWKIVKYALQAGVRSVYLPNYAIRPNSVPAICKVDLMLSDEGFKIAEIDGYNERGMGYSTLAASVRDMLYPNAEKLPGVVAKFVQEVLRRNNDTVIFLHGNHERFYIPEFRIFQYAVRRQGVNVVLVSESDLFVKGDSITYRGELLPSNLFVIHPFLNYNQPLNLKLQELYARGEIDFLIPPKPFFGSKALLALLRNDETDPVLEAILRSQISYAALQVIRQHIPQTFLLRKKLRLNLDDKRYVLKESISSGMKGTIFSDDPAFASTYGAACKMDGVYVLQEEVDSIAMPFGYFNENGQLDSAYWYMRVTAHYIGRQLADLIVTARQDKAVHGAVDCLQLGTVIV